MSYATEPCEGRLASPSNPSPPLSDGPCADRDGEGEVRTPSSRRDPPSLVAAVIFRCTAAEKALLISRAELAGVSLSLLMREALGLVDAKRRRPVPKADPALLRELGRIGGNLNQVARWLNTTSVACKDVDALVVAARLVAIERSLSALARPAERPPC